MTALSVIVLLVIGFVAALNLRTANASALLVDEPNRATRKQLDDSKPRRSRLAVAFPIGPDRQGLA
jgi:hypothetical protein